MMMELIRVYICEIRKSIHTIGDEARRLHSLWAHIPFKVCARVVADEELVPNSNETMMVCEQQSSHYHDSQLTPQTLRTIKITFFHWNEKNNNVKVNAGKKSFQDINPKQTLWLCYIHSNTVAITWLFVPCSHLKTQSISAKTSPYQPACCTELETRWDGRWS